jgi:hypothetical protein
VYTLARLGIFLVAFGVVWAVSSRWLDWNASTGLVTALIALLVSAPTSYLLLRRLRDKTALEVADRADRLRDAFARSRRDLDDEPVQPGPSSDRPMHAPRPRPADPVSPPSPRDGQADEQRE